MRARQPVSLDGIEFDALIDITESLEADAPEYPVEEGYNVNDTIILKPRQINLTVYLSNTPVTWKERFGDTKDRVNDVCTKLYELYEEKKPVILATTDAVYEDYCITSISLPRNVDNGTSMEIPITLKEIRKTQTKTTTIPASYKRAGKTKTNAGTATTGSGSGITTTSTKATNSTPSNKSSNKSSSSSSSSGKKAAKAESKKNASILYGMAGGLFK